MPSVKTQFSQLVSNFESQIASSGLRQDSQEFQELLTKNIGQLLELKTVVHSKLALFSDNEGLEDLSTSSMPLLAIDFHLAWLISKKQAFQLQDARDKNVVRLKFLRKAVQLYMQFLVSLQGYKILNKEFSKKLDSMENVYDPKLEDLYPQPTNAEDLSSAHLKRQQKIEAYQHDKRLEAQIKALEFRNSAELSANDDELVRELQKTQLEQTAYKAVHEIEQLLYEIELLSNFVKIPELPSTDSDSEKKDPLQYTEKLETLNTPLISKTGKVLRNFTLVDQKTQLKNKVFGFGQYGPTMSVEEFLEQEFESGRVLQGGEEPVSEPDEDNQEWQDEQTYKARGWDEFKETHAKGSGNTMNRG
ncbi:LAME_0H12134g1_1 [Lachancea meyersii CBS 8951]|uniref:LAME_0H12134g1_1 n=1 Tax=Lachancea meyersii CBS 8951 TaxID=1266667 RepID=A0A1G4KGH3_9SACH|nr:LAME_0H12134g1_1 [Lachancea meyersii CBS 8951]